VERINEFLAENRVAFLVGILLLVLVCWLHKDNRRNDGVYNDTNNAVADLERRIDRIEQRVDSVSARLDQAEKTNTELGGRIESSTAIAKEVATGIDGLQDRLDSAVQRSGRIANIIADIEAKNRP
jgi:methyl-accepting chemotaxis protein